MNRLKTLLAAALLSISLPVLALDLATAKAAGVLGEQANGYLGVIQSTPEAIALANDINQRRRQAYERIAKENGTTLDQVAALTGVTAIEKAPAGTWVQGTDGRWVRKP